MSAVHHSTTSVQSRHLNQINVPVSRRAAKRSAAILAAATALALAGQSAHADSAVWSGATDGQWSVNSNWVGTPAAVPGTNEAATFNSASSNTTIDIGAALFVGSINFDTASAAAYTIGTSGQYLYLDGLTTATNSITMASTVTTAQTINANLVSANIDNVLRLVNSTPVATGPAMIINGTIEGGTGSVHTVNATGNVVINGAMFAGAAVSMNLANVSTGTVTLGGSATSNLAVFRASDSGWIVVDGQTVNVSNETVMGRSSSTHGKFELKSGIVNFNGGIRTNSSVNDGTTIRITGGDFTAASLTIGRSWGLNNTTNYTIAAPTSGLHVTGGSATFTTNVTLGNSNANSSGLVTGGTLTVGGELRVGDNAPGRIHMFQNNGGTVNVNGALVVARNGNAGLLLTGGTTTTERLAFGGPSTATNANGVITLNGAAASLYVGSGGITRDSVNGLATINLVNGTLGAKGDWSAAAGIPIFVNGAVNIKAADQADVARNMILGTVSGASTFNKTGGGTLTLGGALTGFTGGVNVTAGVLALDAAAIGSTTYSGSITGAGSLKKTGGGTVTLSGSSNPTGGTTVEGGTLLLASTGALPGGLTVNAGTFGGVGSAGATTVANNGAAVITNNTIGGQLTLSSLAFGGAATVDANLAGGSTAAVAVSGALSTTPANGQVTLDVSNTSWASGFNNIISFGSFGGSITDFTLAPISGLSGRQSVGGLALNGNNVAVIINGDTTIWTGLNGAIWDEYAQSTPTTGTPSFALKNAQTATDFWVSDTVEFNDTYNLGSGDVTVTNTTATISGGNVSPTLVKFNNSAVNYTINSGDGSGIDTGAVLKEGTGEVAINSVNTYSGGTTINGGTIAINSASSLGSGSVVINAGAVRTTANITETRQIALGGASSTVSVDSGTTFTSSGVITNGGGAGTLNKTGAGTLVLTTPNTHTGGTTINAGTLVISDNNQLGDPVTAAPLTLNNGSTLSVPSGLTLDNGGLNPRPVVIGATGANLDIPAAGTLTLTGPLTGGTATILGTGRTLRMSGTTSTAPIIVNNSELRAVVSGGTGSGTVTLMNNATMTTDVGTAVTWTVNNAIDVPAGHTGYVAGKDRFTMNGAVSGAGTLDVVVASDTATNWNISNNFAAFTGTLFLHGTPTSQIRMLNNGGGFNTGGWASTNLVLDGNVQMQQRTNSTGNTYTIGALSSVSATTGFLGGEFGRATISVGGLNTNTTFAGFVTGNSNLTKVGTGVLTITGAISHTGATTVNAGTLAVVNDGVTNLGSITSPTVSIAGGVLDVSGAAGYSTATGQTLTTGTAGGTIAGNYLHDEGTITVGGTASATLTANNNFDISGGAIIYTGSPSLVSGNDLINVTGSTLANGNVSVAVNTNSSFATGNYTLLTAAGGLGASDVSAWTVDTSAARPGSTGTVSISGNSILLGLNIAPSASLKWAGTTDGVAVAGTWDNLTTANWQNPALPGLDKFYATDAVTFADTYDGVNAPLTTAVTLNSTVLPSAVTVNSTLNYTISGTGAIGGTTGLTKSGSGVLTITNGNSYTGGTTINGGTVLITTTGALGSGSTVLNNGALQIDTGNATFSPSISVSAAGGTLSSTTAGLLRISDVSGTGKLFMAASVTKGIDFVGSHAGFSGTLEWGSDVNLRIQNAAAGSPSATYDLNVPGARMALLLGSTPQVVQLGALKGVSGSILMGLQGTGSATPHTFEIGALNTSTVFAGNVNDGEQGTTTATSINKVGTGTLSLTGTNSYTGTTTVTGGALAMVGAAAHSPVLAGQGAILNGGKLVMDYTGGTSPKAALVDALDGIKANAANPAVGRLRTTLTTGGNEAIGWSDDGSAIFQARYTYKGDINLDGAVTSTDFAAFAANYGMSSGAEWSNGDFDYSGAGAGKVTTQDFNYLAGNFGAGPISGSVPSATLGAVVPEPSTLGLLGAAAMGLISRRRRNA